MSAIRNVSGSISRNTGYTIRQQTEREKAFEYRRTEYRRLFAKQDGLCGLCREPLHKIRRYNHLDHWYPVVAGGKTEDGNMVILHMECNLSKGSKILE